MNAKKKNKNRQKPPKIPQKDETKESESLDNVSPKIEKCEKKESDNLLSSDNLSPKIEVKSENIKESVTLPILDTNTLKTQAESEKKDESIPLPNITNIESSQIENLPANDTPKKPKRNKGKKKQEKSDNAFVDSTEKVDIDIMVKSDEPEAILSDTQDALMVTPKTRKKKNKDKKQSETQENKTVDIPLVIEEKTAKEELKESEKQINIPHINTPEPDNSQEQENKVSKKKKKKRNRHDSEKSDVNAENLCTLTFKKLLESTESPDDENQNKEIGEVAALLDEGKMSQFELCPKLKLAETSDKKNLDTDIKLDTEILVETSVKSDTENPITDIKDEGTKSKKKNKKNKQREPKIDPSWFGTKNETAEMPVDDGNQSALKNAEKRLSPAPPEIKVKAKIAKPVERKQKVKEDLQPICSTSHEIEKVNTPTDIIFDKVIPSTTSDSLIQLVIDESKNVESMTEPKECTGDNAKKKQIDQQTVVPTLESKCQEQLICKHIETLVSQDDKKDDEIVEESINDGFTRVQQSKKKKKQQQRCSDTDKPSTHLDEFKLEPEVVLRIDESDINLLLEDSNKPIITNIADKEKSPTTSIIDESENKRNTDESPDSNITIPDIIQYPRSASQQLLDTNNNTIIQEISIQDEIKLGIPIYTPTPVVQGSGETPEVKQEVDPLQMKVTEIDEKLSKCVQEKTDIKSKMMEVSQDMEELRLSIERSLAELTALDASDKEFEMKNEKKIAASKDFFIEGPKTEPCQIAMPSVLVSKQTPQTDSHDVHTRTHVCISPDKEIIAPKSIDIIDKTKPTDTIMAISEPSIGPSSEEVCILSEKEKNIPEPIVKEDEIKPSETIATPSEPICLSKKEVPISQDKEIIPPAPTGKLDEIKPKETTPVIPSEPPVCPSRKDKGKGKSKKKSKQENTSSRATTSTGATTSENKESTKSAETSKGDKGKSEKTEQKQKDSQEKGKQQSLESGDISSNDSALVMQDSFEPIESFEDALTSSVDDVNKTFEMIANEVTKLEEKQYVEKPQINIIAPAEDEEKEKIDEKRKKAKENPVSQPKNLLGHPDIPVPSNKTDYKKEKNKQPNSLQAKVKIKDSVDIEKSEKQSKKSQTCNKRNLKNMNGSESFSYMTNENDEFIYKYSFRKVFLPSACHVCKTDIVQRVPCKFCSLIFYCSQKHMNEDWPRHQSLCFAVSTISHLKDQKHIYADAKGITGQDYRVLRMQMIISCEKILKRKLVPWEQEALLYPRICADVNCREWRQTKLKDCEGCNQISYCADYPDHLPYGHQRWCKSYALYQKLVNYQQTKGRLEPLMPGKVLDKYEIPEKINDVLASMFEEKIDMNDIQYAALTQLATSPLTAAYCYQLYTKKNPNTVNGLKKTDFTIHAVGAELQFEADGLNKWEVFFLHLRPDIKDLRVVLIGPELNPSNLPLDLLGKIKLCDNCRNNKRRVIFSFQNGVTYHTYYNSDEFIIPDIVCAFNPSIQRSLLYNGKDSWTSTIQCILKQKVPFILTAYTLEELQRDLVRVKDCGGCVTEAKLNPFASVRPDRNFITDHEIPLLFKNYCCSIVCGV